MDITEILLQDCWQNIINNIKKEKTAYAALFTNTKMYANDGGTLIIEFPEDSKFSFDIAQKPEVQEALARAIHKVFGSNASFVIAKDARPYIEKKSILQTQKGRDEQNNKKLEGCCPHICFEIFQEDENDVPRALLYCRSSATSSGKPALGSYQVAYGYDHKTGSYDKAIKFETLESALYYAKHQYSMNELLKYIGDVLDGAMGMLFLDDMSAYRHVEYSILVDWGKESLLEEMEKAKNDFQHCLELLAYELEYNLGSNSKHWNNFIEFPMV